jgi:tRNA nucleotidyltransferase (CCA-adding enzyme)
MKIFRVGGHVRDSLLGLPVRDSDWVVVGSSPEELTAAGYQPVGRDFPVFLHPVTHEEYALARTERKSGRGYKGFQVHADPSVTLEEDLRRRDLTINAIAQAEDGTIIDPFGGRADLRNRVLRHVSAAFIEDPLRILRVARFAARFEPLGFRIAEDTLSLMCDMVSAGELADLTPERVWAELSRALEEQTPATFFEVLRACGALTQLFPEIAALFGVPQRPDYHPEIDTGVHTMMVLEQAAALSHNPVIRFAALTHDLGKGLTSPDKWPDHANHEERGAGLVKDFCQRWRAPKEFRDLAIIMARYHGICHRANTLSAEDIVNLFNCIDVMRRPQRLEQLLIACEADARGRLGKERDPYPQATLLRAAFGAAQSVDIAPLRAKGLDGRALGEAISRLRIDAVAALLANKADILVTM